MHSCIGKTSLIAASIAGAFVVSPGPLRAEDVLEEIVVTARRRAESLQEAPVAITALSGADLENSGIRSSVDLRMVVPNVDVYGGNGTSATNSVFIRGVGARNTAMNNDAGVGMYLDGMYLSRTEGAILDNVDISSVQVLRGPQGTLFGKNTTGGAIIYTTNRPVDEFEGNAQVRAGNYDRLDGKFTVNVPLVEDLLNARVSAFSTQRDGYVENKTLDQEMNDEDRKGGQLHFLLTPSDAVEIDFNNFYSELDQRPRGLNCELVTDVPGAGWQAIAQDGLIIVPSTGKSIAEHCRDNEALGRDEVLSDLAPSRYHNQNYIGALTVNWEVRAGLAFKSVTGFRNTHTKESSDLDGMAIPLLHNTSYGIRSDGRDTDQWSQEFQLSGTAFDGDVNWVGGVYLFSEETESGAVYGITGPFFGALFNPNLAFLLDTRTFTDVDNSSYSAFSQVDWDLDEQWTLTAGVRYTTESRELGRRQDVVDAATLSNDGSLVTSPISSFYRFPNGPGSFNPYPDYKHVVTPFGSIPDVDDQTEDLDESKWTPMVSLRRTFAGFGSVDEGSFYATVSTGFLSGGISSNLDLNTRQLTDYEPEEVINYELGLKIEALDRRVRVNTALFHLDYRDRQLTSVAVSEQGRVAQTLVNAEESSITGLEIESLWLPVDDLQLTVNLTFNDGDIEEFDDRRIVVPGSLPEADCIPVRAGGIQVDDCAVDRSDEDLPRLPQAIYFLAAQYTFHTPVGDVSPRIQWSLRTDVENCFDRSSCLSGVYFGDQRELAARLNWTSPDLRWSVTAYGNNLTDERYIVGGVPLVDVTRTAGTVYNDPRMYGVELNYTW